MANERPSEAAQAIDINYTGKLERQTIPNHRHMGKEDRDLRRAKYHAIIAVALCFAIVAACGTFIFYLTRADRNNEKHEDVVQQHVENQDYSQAHNEALDTGTQTGLSWKDTLLQWVHGVFKAKNVDTQESDDLRNNGVSPGETSDSFQGRTKEQVKKALIENGFLESKITFLEMPSDPKQYPNLRDGDVIEVVINGNKNYKATDDFLPNKTPVEIHYFMNNTVSPGKTSKQFAGMNVEEVKQDLVRIGFREDKVELVPVTSNRKKYANTEDGTVLRVEINNKQRYKATDTFDPDKTVVKIRYLTKG